MLPDISPISICHQPDWFVAFRLASLSQSRQVCFHEQIAGDKSCLLPVVHCLALISFKLLSTAMVVFLGVCQTSSTPQLVTCEFGPPHRFKETYHVRIQRFCTSIGAGINAIKVIPHDSRVLVTLCSEQRSKTRVLSS